MPAKAAISLLDSATITGTTTEVDVNLSAFASMQLLVSTPAGNPPEGIAYDFKEVNPITGITTGGQPLGSSQNINPGSSHRYQFSLPSILYRLTATSHGDPALLTATIVAMA